jgi:hypothetical protein
MTLVIPLHTRESLNSPLATDEPFLLFTATDSTLVTPLRLCSLPVTRLSSSPLKYGVVSNGEEFEYRLSGTLPSDQEGTALHTVLTCDNADLALTDTFVALTSSNTVRLDVVLTSDPDIAFRSFPLLRIVLVEVDDLNIVLTLDRNPSMYGESGALEPYPSGLQTYYQAPGLHR